MCERMPSCFFAHERALGQQEEGDEARLVLAPYTLLCLKTPCSA